MSGERWIIVDTGSKPGGTRFLGAEDWSETVRGAVPFMSREDAQKRFDNIRFAHIRERSVVRRVVTAVTKRARAAAQADADNVATMRAELDGLRATDAECAAALARWQFRAEIAETAYDGLRTEFESARHTLGATDAESVVAAAMRVVSERDGAVRDLAELRRAIEVLTVRMGG